MPTHYELSRTRLTYQQQRLQKNKELKKKYDDIIEEQLRPGIVEPVSTENENRVNNPKIHYLSQHAVAVREGKATTKVRIVFNGSAKLDSDELSINKCLERKPNLDPSLFDILVRFSSHLYALVADIEKETTKVLENKLFVDDLATGTESEDNAIRLYKSAKQVMNKGGFNLRKWNSVTSTYNN